jgi:hypothetical protein
MLRIRGLGGPSGLSASIACARALFRTIRVKPVPGAGFGEIRRKADFFKNF